MVKNKEYHEEFLDNLDQFSESWRNQIAKEK